MVLDFLESVLPPEGTGFRVAAAFVNGLKAPPKQAFYETNEQLANAAAKISAAGIDFYHACASFVEKGTRKGTNVAAIKSLWIDLDVGENKPYRTQRDAAVAYETFRLAVGLAPSWIVSSGGGLHIYQPLTKAIPPEKWDKLAALYAACLDHAGVKHDTSRTRDKASILRTPGTANYKQTPARPVTIKRAGQAAPAKEVWERLVLYAQSNNVSLSQLAQSQPKQEVNDLMGAPPEFPPSDSSLVAARCAVLGEVDASGGDVSYDIWWRALGVAKHTTSPQETALRWTRRRLETGHSKIDALGVMDAWTAGPTTCAEFSKHSQKCAGCQHAQKIKSPIQLGTPEQPAIKLVAIPVRTTADEDASGAAAVSVEVPTLPDQWGFKTEWVVSGRCKATHTGVNSNGQLTRSVKTGEDDEGKPIYTHVPFCDRYWQVTRRIRDTDGRWKLEITYETYPGRPPACFLFDSANVLVPDAIKKEFSAREIHIYGGKTAIEKASHLMISDQELLRAYQQEAVTYPTMGWVTQDNNPTGPITGEFILGTTLFAPGKPPTEVLLSDTVTSRFGGAFQCSGSTARWVQLVDEIYNRKGAEPYQFVIAAMFASPLVKLVPGGGEWHGIPIGIGGDSGAAKTTTALVATSIYTKGQALKFNASPQQGDTINALAIKVGALKNIPCIIDELTNAEPDRVSSILFMMANGQPKDRATQHATLVNNPYRWDMTSIISSNDNLHDLLENASSKDAQNAGKLRLFQIDFRAKDIAAVFPDVPKHKIEHDLLGEQYGMVGRDWIQFVVNNQVKIQNILSTARAQYIPPQDEGTETRFFRDLILVTYIAARLAKQRGFIRWDVEAMREWAEQHLLKLRIGIARSDWESDISDLLASLNGRTIITKHFKEGRGRRHNMEVALSPIAANVIPVARKALEDMKFFVSENYVREWCKFKKIPPKYMMHELAARGYVKVDGNGNTLIQRINLGSGTEFTRPRAACIELNYEHVAGIEPEVSTDGNVVAFPAPEPLPTSDETADAANV